MNQTDYKQRLIRTEQHRLRMQSEFDGRRSSRARNRLGQFATPPALAWEMLELARQHYAPSQQPIRFLDPGIGTGVFFSALMDTFEHEHIQMAVLLQLVTYLLHIAGAVPY